MSTLKGTREGSIKGGLRGHSRALTACVRKAGEAPYTSMGG